MCVSIVWNPRKFDRSDFTHFVYVIKRTILKLGKNAWALMTAPKNGDEYD